MQLDFFLSDKVTVKIMFPLFKGTDFWEKLSTEIIREQNRSQIKTVNGLDVIDFHGIKFLRFFSALIFDVKFAPDSCTNIYFLTRDEAIQKHYYPKFQIVNCRIINDLKLIFIDAILHFNFKD